MDIQHIIFVYYIMDINDNESVASSAYTVNSMGFRIRKIPMQLQFFSKKAETSVDYPRPSRNQNYTPSQLTEENIQKFNEVQNIISSKMDMHWARHPNATMRHMNIQMQEKELYYNEKSDTNSIFNGQLEKTNTKRSIFKRSTKLDRISESGETAEGFPSPVKFEEDELSKKLNKMSNPFNNTLESIDVKEFLTRKENVLVSDYRVELFEVNNRSVMNKFDVDDTDSNLDEDPQANVTLEVVEEEIQDDESEVSISSLDDELAAELKKQLPPFPYREDWDIEKNQKRQVLEEEIQINPLSLPSWSIERKRYQEYLVKKAARNNVSK